MSAASRRSRDLARGVIELEAGGATESDALAETANRAFARFREHMDRLAGSIGFEALARRALGRARDEHPFLRDVVVSVDASIGLDGLSEALRGRDPGEVHAALESILAHVIDLLFRFLGGRMTVQLLRGAWPELEAPGGPERPAEKP